MDAFPDASRDAAARLARPAPLVHRVRPDASGHAPASGLLARAVPVPDKSVYPASDSREDASAHPVLDWAAARRMPDSADAAATGGPPNRDAAVRPVSAPAVLPEDDFQMAEPSPARDALDRVRQPDAALWALPDAVP